MPGSAFDTQTTAPWIGTGTDSQAAGLPAPMTLHEIMHLPGEEAGVVMFSGEFRLSDGATAFVDFFTADFIEATYKPSLLLSQDAPATMLTLVGLLKQHLKLMTETVNLDMHSCRHFLVCSN